MTPSKIAKEMGLKSLAQVSVMTGVSSQTLTNWHKNKPALFRTVLMGCLFDVGMSLDNRIEQ